MVISRTSAITQTKKQQIGAYVKAFSWVKVSSRHWEGEGEREKAQERKDEKKAGWDISCHANHFISLSPRSSLSLFSSLFSSYCSCRGDFSSPSSDTIKECSHIPSTVSAKQSVTVKNERPSPSPPSKKKTHTHTLSTAPHLLILVCQVKWLLAALFKYFSVYFKFLSCHVAQLLRDFPQVLSGEHKSKWKFFLTSGWIWSRSTLIHEQRCTLSVSQDLYTWHSLNSCVLTWQLKYGKEMGMFLTLGRFRAW